MPETNDLLCILETLLRVQHSHEKTLSRLQLGCVCLPDIKKSRFETIFLVLSENTVITNRQKH